VAITIYFDPARNQLVMRPDKWVVNPSGLTLEQNVIGPLGQKTAICSYFVPHQVWSKEKC
jgi:hypothetical protein